MSEYRYAYLGSGSQVHIQQVGHGLLCRPLNTDHWTPTMWKELTVGEGNLWITLVAAHTLCARCRKAFEAEVRP